MKIFSGVMLATALSGVFLAGCNSAPSKGGEGATSTTSGSTGSTDKKLTIGIVFDKGGIDDKSFNASAWKGMEKAKSELGVEVKSLESREEKDYESNLTAMVDQGCDLIIGVGINMQSAMEKVAKDNADSKFALVDAYADLPNLRGLKFKEEEGSFLAGYLAGLMSTSKKIGFVGGQQIPLIVKFYSGYVAGAKMANPAIEALPPKYTGDWNNVDVAKEAAKALFGAGADIVYHAAGKAGLGVITAAKEGNKMAIGVDSDQDELAPGFVLTSMVKSVDAAVFSSIKDLIDGKFTPGEVIYDLKAGGVGLSEMKFTKDKIGAANIEKVNQVKEQILSGEIKVPTDEASLASFLAGLKK